MRRNLLIVIAFILVALAGLSLHVWTSITGRGGRPAEGTRHIVSSDGAVPEVVYLERLPERPRPNAAPVVLLASFARSIADFNELTADLTSEGYRTLAVESRGIGGSGGGGPGQDLTLHDLASDVHRVLEEAGVIGRVHLVGHAYGNRVVRTFAADHPARVASVSLIAAGGLLPIRTKETRRALEESVAAYYPLARREPALRHAFFSEKSKIPAHWVGGWWAWGGFAQYAATAATSSDDFWGAGGADLLVIQGDDDTLAPPEDAGLRLLADFPSRVELVRLPDAGHAMLPEKPVQIRDALLGFLARHP